MQIRVRERAGDVRAASDGTLQPPCAKCAHVQASVARSPLDALAGREPRWLCHRHHLAELFELLEIAQEARMNDPYPVPPDAEDDGKDNITTIPHV